MSNLQFKSSKFDTQIMKHLNKQRMDEPSFPGVEEVKPIPSDMILKSKRLQQQQKKQQQSNLNQQQQQQQIELDEDGNLLEEQEGDEEHEEDDGDEEIGVVGNDKKQLDKIAEAKRLDNKRKRQVHFVF